jgi:integrase
MSKPSISPLPTLPTIPPELIPFLIQEAMGHADLRTTLMYAHITTAKRREELARLLE